MLNLFRIGAVALIASVVMTASPAQSAPKKRVACTLTTIEALVREVAGDKVESFSLAAGDQDPHFVAPTPSLMKRVREADVLLEMGMQLEPWADEVANGSGNPRIFRGAPGRVVLSTGISKLEIPTVVSRAQGDVHPEGNPHIWLDPMRTKILAENVARALKTLSPEDAPFFEGRLRDFQQRIDRALFGDELLRVVGSAKLTRLTTDGRLHDFLESNEYGGKKLATVAGGWLAKGRALRGEKTIEVHKVWAYFAATFGFQIVGTIEERPGIQPGPRHVSETIELAKREGVHLILVDNFYDAALPNRIGADAGARVVLLPNQVSADKAVTTYFELVDHILNAMLKKEGKSQ